MMEKLNALLAKYNNFKYDQLRSIEPLTENSKRVTLVVQDDDGEDVNTIKIEFNGIKDSRILEAGVLSFLDMSSGITLLKENELYGFALGSGSAMLHVHNAPLYIVASDISIEES